MAPVHEEVHVGREERDRRGDRADHAVPQPLAGDHLDDAPRVGDRGDDVYGPQDPPVPLEMRDVHDGHGADERVGEDDHVGDELRVAAQSEEEGALDDGGSHLPRRPRRRGGGCEGVQAGHGLADEGPLPVGALGPRFEELQGRQGDRGEALVGGPRDVDDALAQFGAQPVEVPGGDPRHPQAAPALDGVVEFVGEGALDRRSGGDPLGGDVVEDTGVLGDARGEVAGPVHAGQLDDQRRVPLEAPGDVEVQDRAERDEVRIDAHVEPLVGGWSESIVPQAGAPRHQRPP